MIEEIKKEILKNCNVHKIETDDYGNTKRYIHIETEKFYEILDKYNNQEPKAILHIGMRGGKALKQAQDIAKYITDNKLVECNINVLEVPNYYKKAWEELKEDCREVEKDNDYILYERLQQLEQKYGIGE
jgi:pyrrolidone-carboxylate peptidase